MDRPNEEDFLIIPTLAKNKEEVCYEIFAVPIEGLGRQTMGLLRPKIVVKCSKFFQKLCVVGSIVYLFSGNIEVGTFDLSFFLSSKDEDEEEVVLRDEMIRYISPMKSEKRCVEAVPTPSRKVLAFSRSISLGSCFELYDPNTDTWEDVPQIEQHLHPLGEIKFYYFIDNYTFGVQTSRGKTYQLNIKCPINKSIWQDCGRSGCRSPISGFPRAILGSGFELCFSGNAVWDIKNAGGVHKAVASFPSSTFHPPFKTKSRMIISRGRWSRCYILEIAKKSGEYYLSIEEYHMELVEYFEEKKALEEKYFEEEKALEEKFFDHLERLEHKMLVNRMKFTSPYLGWFLLRESTFLLGPEFHRLEDETTFSI